MNEIIISTKAAGGALAKWAIRQSPYGWAEDLDFAVGHIRGQREGFDNVGGTWMRTFTDQREIEKWFHAVLSDHDRIRNLLTAWNTRRNKREGMGAASAYWTEPHPDDDFIDIDALVRNAARDLCDEQERSDAFDSAWEAKNGISVADAFRAEFREVET